MSPLDGIAAALTLKQKFTLQFQKLFPKEAPYVVSESCYYDLP